MRTCTDRAGFICVLELAKNVRISAERHTESTSLIKLVIDDFSEETVVVGNLLAPELIAELARAYLRGGLSSAKIVINSVKGMQKFLKDLYG